MTLTTIRPHIIRCGCCLSFHSTATDIRNCYADVAEGQAQAEAESAAELAYERKLEDAGWQEATAQDDYEARNGVVGFIESWHLASPETCPCSAH